LILTHPHLDHLSGLIEVLHRYQVKQVLAPNLISDSPSYQEWVQLIKTQNIKYVLAQAGQEIKFANGANLTILNPPDTAPSNLESDLENNGIIVRLTWNKISFLFTADIGQEAEARLISRRTVLTCTVLKVAHHGSSTSTTSDFLKVAQPQVAAISVGSENTFGHPNENTLMRLKQVLSNNNIYRTDKSGTIDFTTDGQKLWVKTEK
jgi:competence protein ComEC